MIGAFGGFLISILLVYGFHLNDWWMLWATLTGIGVELLLRMVSGNAPNEAICDAASAAVDVAGVVVSVASTVGGDSI